MSQPIRLFAFPSLMLSKALSVTTLAFMLMFCLVLTDKQQFCHADITSLISNALVKQATQTLKIEPKQAIGGIGSILQMAGDSVSSNKFDLLKKAIPDASKLIAQAPTPTTNSKSDFSSFSPEGLLGSLGPITSQFASLGLGSDMIAPLVNVVLDYLKGNKSNKAYDILESALPTGLIGGSAKSLFNAL